MDSLVFWDVIGKVHTASLPTISPFPSQPRLSPPFLPVFGRPHKDFWPAKIVTGSLHNWLGCTAGACFIVFGGLHKWSLAHRLHSMGEVTNPIEGTRINTSL
jgi:hypothetical protein